MNSILKSKSTTPTLRFKEFNKEWSKKRLSTLLKVSRKRNTDNKYSKDDVLSVSGQFGVVNQVELLGRSYAGKVVNNYHVVETNDVVYTKSPLKSNPYGIIKINQGKSGIVSTLYAIYKIKDGHCPKFIGKYFESDDRTNSYLRPLVHKGAKNDMKITNERVLIDSIFVPALLEQQKIADFLGSVDAWLDNLRQQKAALEEYKKGCMQKLFTQQVRFKDDNGKEFPRWQTVQMSDIGDAFNGLSGKTGEAFGEGEPYITYKQIFAKSVINPDGFDFVKVTPSERQNRSQFYGETYFS
jgi:type I restriction enzyme S subunit